MVNMWVVGYYLGVGAHMQCDFVEAEDEQDAVKWWEDNKYKHSKFTEEDEEAFCYTHQCENCPYIGGGEFGGCTEWLHADKSRISFKDMVDLYEECGE